MLHSFKRDIIKLYGDPDSISVFPNPIVIVGGGGFIGKNLSKILKELNVKCLVVDRAFHTSSEYGETNQVHCNLNDLEDIQHLLKLLTYSFDVIFLATPVITDGKSKNNSRVISDKINSLDPIEESFLNVFNFVTSFKELIRNFVYVSSFEVYGSNLDKDMVIDEKTEVIPESIYELSKFSGEKACIQTQHLLSGNLGIFRPSQVTGPFEGVTYNRLIPLLLNSFSRGENVTLEPGMNTSRQFVSTYQLFAHIFDFLLAEEDRFIIRNVVGRPSSIETIAQLCLKVVNAGSYEILETEVMDRFRATIKVNASKILNTSFHLEYEQHLESVFREILGINESKN
jgi:nucleoside-diphosphate-sugar epimerase